MNIIAIRIIQFLSLIVALRISIKLLIICWRVSTISVTKTSAVINAIAWALFIMLTIYT